MKLYALGWPDDEVYCRQCGEDEKLDCGNTFANGTEIICQNCKYTFSADLDKDY